MRKAQNPQRNKQNQQVMAICVIALYSFFYD